jgi:ribosomal protein S18 acetylase RimI-like enzyme
MAKPVDPLLLEQLAFRAWPAEEVVDAGGFRLRAMRGVTRRANSAWVDPCAREMPVDGIAGAEAFYSERGLPCLVQLAAVSAKPGLDELLAARGYALEAPVSVQIAEADAVAGVNGSPAASARPAVERTLTNDWFVTSVSTRFAGVAEVYRGLLARLGDRAAFARAELDGQCVAVGLGVIDDGWCGIFSMHTLTPHRRRGIGRTLVQALAQNARDRGAHQLYLQVERDNAPALALYRGLGFVESYGYHYRRRTESDPSR